MNVGTEWLVDADGCSAERLRNIEAARSVCEEVVADLGLRVVGEPKWHQFPQPGGVTGLYLLTESHLACHTFPETGLATFNLYCCRPRPAFAWEERLRALLGASRVIVRTAARGTEAGAEHDSLQVGDHASLDVGGYHSLELTHCNFLEAGVHDSLEADKHNSGEADEAERPPKGANQASFESEVSDSTSAREVSGL